MDELTTQACISVPGLQNQGAVQAIALRKWEVRGKIHWPVARYCISQLFQNTGSRALEIVYTFPLSSDQLLERFSVHLNGKQINSKVVMAEEAEEIYEDMVNKGDFALQLQTHRSNVFTLNIGNLAPEEWVRVEFELCQLLEIRQGNISVRVPTVVGPRYIPGEPTGAPDGLGWATPTDQVPDADWITPPFDFNGTPYLVSAIFEITPSLPIRGIESPSHPFQMKIDGRTYWAVMGEELKADRDIVLNIQVEPQAQNTIWQIPYRERQIFALSVSGNGNHKSQTIPRDVLFLIDISGSMCGEKIETAIKGVKLCLRKLKQDDRFQLIAFESTTHRWKYDWQPFTEQSLQAADTWLSELTSMGGTELYPALKQALRLQSPENRQKVVILLTDGEVGNEDRIVNLIRNKGSDNYMLLFGIDTAVNQHLFTGIEKVVPAITEYIFPGEDITRKVNLQFQTLDKPWLKHIELMANDSPIPAKSSFPQFPLPLDHQSKAFIFLEADDSVRQVDNVRLVTEDENRYTVPVDFNQHLPFIEKILLKFWAKNLIHNFEIDPAAQENKERLSFVKELALDLQLQSRFTRWIATMERKDKIEEPAEVQVVPVAFPYLWEPDYFRFSHSLESRQQMKLTNIPMEDERVLVRYHKDEYLLHAKMDFHERNIPDVLLFQKADGRFEISNGRNRAKLETLVLLLWLFQKVRSSGLSLVGYEENLRKALDFLENRQNHFDKTETFLWLFLVTAYRDIIVEICPSCHTIAQKTISETDADWLRNTEHRLSTLFEEVPFLSEIKFSELAGKLRRIAKEYR